MQSFYQFERLARYEKIIHGVTLKDNLQAYQYSLALHTGETPKEIVSNRWSVAKQLLTFEDIQNYKFIVANQTHSDNIVVIDTKRSAGWEEFETAIEDCDALISNQKGVILTILTADCVPILLYDPHQGAVSAIHAGWKGTKMQIALKTIHRMRDVYGSNPQDIIASIAPSIGFCCYEVGSEVANHFAHYHNDCIPQENQKFMLNLPNINRSQLIEAGVVSENIEMSGICTACEVESYFSYRKEGGCSGRFMSLIGLRV